MTALSYCTVIGKIQRVDNNVSTPIAGTVTLTPNTLGAKLLLQTETPPRSIVVDPVTVTLDGTGSFSTTVIATDQTGVTLPTGWTWTATFQLLGFTLAPFSFAAPSGGTVDVTLVAPIPAASGLTYIAGPAGPAGPAGTMHSVTAADSSITVAGTSADPTVRVGKLSTVGLPFNVKDYGATGNGVTDDTTAITSAMTAASGGGVVYFPPGVYLISSAIAIPSLVTAQGAGPYSTRIRTSSTTADIFTSTSTVVVGIRDLQIEALVTRTAGNAINMATVTDYIIDNVRFQDTYNYALLDTCNSGWISRIKIEHGTGVTNRGFYFKKCVDTHIFHVIGNGGGLTLASSAAWFQFDSGNDTIFIEDLSIVPGTGGTGKVLWFTNTIGGSFAPRGIRINKFACEGSSAGNAGYPGIWIDACLDLKASNGTMATCESGLKVLGGTDITFHNATFENNWLYGATVDSCSFVIFRDCTFSDNSQGTTNTFEHLIIGGAATNVRVQGCKFGNMLVGGAAKSNYAINNAGASTRAYDNTVVTGDMGTGIFDGTTTITARGNAGYNPRGVLGPPAVPATTVAYTNGYGVDCDVFITGGTVTVIAVAGTATGLTSGSFVVPAGSTITLTYTAAPTWTWFGN